MSKTVARSRRPRNPLPVSPGDALLDGVETIVIEIDRVNLEQPIVQFEMDGALYGPESIATIAAVLAKLSAPRTKGGF